MFSDSLPSSQLMEFSQDLHINSSLNFHYFAVVCFMPSFLLIIYFTLPGNLPPDVKIHILAFVFLLSDFRISIKDGLREV